ncbi:MAG TPA: DUF928 domain-containing protein [Oscillatoriaceae cyanobacterium M33_DOE_052]|uniref:DUF928 domain-containing protein n=1 Tax=Planktothricoides sp. SpSt-374 TaxID=2282167 RepID=A0A7C3VRC2_9CYAN|nr:DUF928 domain-containing protein [Oscillatoriaceae cyanobacterium M33_DOE_052]
MSGRTRLLSTLATVNLLTWAGLLPAGMGVAAPDSPGSPRGELYQVAGYRPPANLGKPPTTGGGSRGETCDRLSNLEGASIPITALVPKSATSEPDWALTVSDRPDFYVYVPPTPAREAEFVLRDEEWNEVYRTSLAIDGAAGIVRVAMPKSAAPLELGKNYRWHFALICPPGQQGSADDISVVEGWTRRQSVDDTLAAALKQATTPREIAEAYAQNGIWHDALTTIATQLQQSPEDQASREEWQDLLASAGLTQFGNLSYLWNSGETP